MRVIGGGQSGPRIDEFLSPSKMTAGQSVAGKFLGTVTMGPENGTVIKIERADGSVLGLNASTGLKTDIQQVEEGTYIQVVFNGKEKTKAGRDFNSFTINAYDDKAEYEANNVKATAKKAASGGKRGGSLLDD